MELTVKAIEKLQGSGARQEFRDDLCRGLSLIIEKTGRKSFVARYSVNGERRKKALGPVELVKLDEAREKVRNLRRDVLEGRDPEEVAAARVETDAEAAKLLIPEVWKDYKARYLEGNARPSTLDKWNRIYEKQIEPKWKSKRIDKLAKKDVLELVDEIAKKGPHAANSLIGALSAFFNWCVSRDIIAASPLAGVKKNTEASRDRTLTNDEVKGVWSACDSAEINKAFAALVRLLILTGCRRNEIAQLKWNEIDTAARVMTIPGERTKNGQPLAIYLTDDMLALLEKLPRFKGSQWVITTAGGVPLSGFSKFKKDLDGETKGVAAWTLHDTRRTFASGLAKLGVPLTTIERCLNHVSDSFSPLVRTYQRHDFAAEMQKAWELWSAHVAAIVADKESNVVRIKGRAKKR